MLSKKLLCIMLITASAHARPEIQLNKNNLPRYTEHYIKTLFGTHNEQPQETREFIKNITKRTETAAQNNCEEFWFYFPMSTFNRECVERTIRTTALNVIVEEANSIAYIYTHDPATLTYITDAINNEVLRIFTETGNLNGALRGYFGENLKQKVLSLKNKFDHEKRELAKEVERRNQSAERRYEEAECCICNYSFDEVAGTYLQPCGHKFCVDCVKNQTLCPVCRATIKGYNR